MIPYIDRIKHFFTQPLLPLSAFQVSSRYLSGININQKNGKIKNHFLFPLEKGIIEPSFFKKNIKKEIPLREKIKEGIEKLQLSDHRVVLLLPEISQRAFIFTFDTLSSVRQEREQIIRFRIKKQIPLLPEDARLSFDLMKSNNQDKVVATIARSSVVKEFEDFFGQFRLKVRAVNAPLLSLLNLINREREKDVMLVNIEEDCFSLAAVLGSEISLYRQKPFELEYGDRESVGHRLEDIAQEIEKTVNFIEDKEDRKISSLLIRYGMLESEDKVSTGLTERLSLPVKDIESSFAFNLPMKEKKILSPLIGQLL